MRTSGSAVSCPRSVTALWNIKITGSKNFKHSEINTKRRIPNGGKDHLALKTEVVIRLCTPVRDKTSQSAWIGFSFQDFTFTRDFETNVLLGKSPFLRKIRTEDLPKEWCVRKMAHGNRDAHPLWSAPKCASPVKYTPPCWLSLSLSPTPRLPLYLSAAQQLCALSCPSYAGFVSACAEAHSIPPSGSARAPCARS